MNEEKIKTICNKVFGAYVAPLAAITSKSYKAEKAVMRSIIKKISSKSYDYVRYSILPKNNSMESSEKSETKLYNKVGIVLQGPIRSENNFTLETVIMYRKMFPGVNIVVSTWDDISETDKSLFIQNNIHLVLNEKPQNHGAGNVNLQLKTSLEGLSFLKMEGCDYCFKTRTDQRVYANDIIKYTMSLDNVFPVREEYKKIMNKRLIFISYGKSYRYLPFALCDFFVCGHIDDMIKLYNIQYNEWPDDYHILRQKDEKEFYTKITSELEPYDNVTPYEIYNNFNEIYYKYMCAESYIIHTYYDKNIKKIKKDDNLMQHYYFFLSQFAIVIDSRETEMLWPKYDIYNSQLESSLDYLSKLDFKKWIQIYIQNYNI